MNEALRRAGLLSFKDIASLSYDPSSDYDYRYNCAFLELLEASNHETLNLIDMEDLLSSFGD